MDVTYEDKLTRKDLDGIIQADHKSLKGRSIKINQRFLEGLDREVIEALFEPEKSFLTVQSPMGTAKTKVIEDILDEAHSRNLAVIHIVNRKSLAQEVRTKYYDNRLRDVKLYSDIDRDKRKDETPGKSNHDLIVQIDSLHYFDMSKYDVVIIDEVSTMFAKLIDLDTHRRKITAQLLSILNHQKLIISDAFAIEPFIEFFGEGKGVMPIRIINTYRDETELFDYSNIDYWGNEALAVVDDPNKDVTMSFGLVKHAKLFREKFMNDKGLSRGLVYYVDGKSSNKVKSHAYRVFDPAIDAGRMSIRVAIWTPTITVGLSNNNENIPRHFHYDQGRTMSVFDSLQMIKRTRKAEEIHMYRGHSANTEITKPIVLENVFKTLDDFVAEFDDYGNENKLSDNGKKLARVIQTMNLFEHYHHEAFSLLLTLQFANLPSTQIDTQSEEWVKDGVKNLSKNAAEKKREDLERWLIEDPQTRQETAYDNPDRAKNYDEFDMAYESKNLTGADKETKLDIVKLMVNDKRLYSTVSRLLDNPNFANGRYSQNEYEQIKNDFKIDLKKLGFEKKGKSVNWTLSKEVGEIFNRVNGEV